MTFFIVFTVFKNQYYQTDILNQNLAMKIIQKSRDKQEHSQPVKDKTTYYYDEYGKDGLNYRVTSGSH